MSGKMMAMQVFTNNYKKYKHMGKERQTDKDNLQMEQIERNGVLAII
jgi:hypothetical protein